jgi:cytoskeletal protein CcmA (bactofilin family)
MSNIKVSELTSGSIIQADDILYISQDLGTGLTSKQVTLREIQESFDYSIIRQDMTVYYSDTYTIGNTSGGTFNSLYLGSGELGLGGQSGSTLYYHTEFDGTATEKDLITNKLHIAQYVGAQGQNSSGITINHTSFGYNNIVSETLFIEDLKNSGRGIYLFEQVVPLMGDENTILARNSDNIADYSWNTPQQVGLATTGSNVFHGDQTISGSLHISGTTTLGGNIVPLAPRGATLGTLELPFADIYVSSGSINIAGIVGQPNTTLSNVSGNILISAGGMQLVGSGSFNATTGSFQYISGSMKQVGDYTQVGNYSISGSKSITGSLYLTGSGGVGFINSHRILTDLDTGSFVTTGSNVFISGQTITGSVNITGSLVVTGSLIMDGTLQTNFSHTVTNPSNYVLHQFLTSSYHGGTYVFSAHEDSTGKVTVYSNYIVAQGGGVIDSKIGGDSKLESTAGAPNPTFAVGFSGSYAQFKVTDNGTFTYRGIVQLY